MSFDPYYNWLGIRDPERPPNHYRLLGVEMFESNIDVITTAADRQMAHLRTYRHGKNYQLSERLLNEVSTARVCLLDADKKAAYDLAIRAEMTPDAPPAQPPESSRLEFTVADDDAGPRRGRVAKHRWPSHHVATLLLVASLVLLAVVLFIQFGPFAGDRNLPDSTPDDLAHVASDDEASSDDRPPDEPSPEDVVEVQPDGGEEPVEVEPPRPDRDVAAAAPWADRNEDSWNRPEFLATSRSSEVLRAISRRDLKTARQLLGLMQEDQSPRSRHHVNQLSLIAYMMERFWNAVDEATLAAREGDTLVFRNQPTQIVSVGYPTQIELEASNGQRKVFGLQHKTADRDLAIALVEQQFADSPPTSWRLIGLFLSLDRRGGDIDEGREFIAQAELYGFEGVYLLQLIDDLSNQTDQRLVTVPVETVEPPDERDKGKHRIPSKEACQQKKREFKTLEPNAARWIEQARRTKDDDVGRYVLLTEAAQLARSDGDVETGLTALDLLNEDYHVEIWRLRYELIQDLIRKQKGAAARRRLANRVLQLSHHAVMEDNYAEADRFAELAVKIAGSTRDKFFRDRLVRARQRVQQIDQAYRGTRSAAELLEKTSDDPAASTELGEFLCFAKGDFVAGLPLLKHGQDAEMRELATRDLTSPRRSADQVQLGDDWQHYAESLEGLYQLHAIDRARHWYEKSLRVLQGESARAVQDKLNEIAIVIGQAERMLDVTRLYPVTFKIGYGNFGVNENPNLGDKTIRSVPEIDGRKITQYLWAHAPSKVEFAVPRGATGFSAVGVYNGESADGARFVVLVDGQQIYSSRPLKSLGQTVDIKAKLPRGARRIVLEVKSITTYVADQTYWVNPVFVF